MLFRRRSTFSLIRFVVALAIGFTFSSAVATAQDPNDPCSPENVHLRVDRAITNYETFSPSDSDPLAALESLETLQTSLNEIYEECDAALQLAEVENAMALLEMLNEGGYVLYVRHTHTDRSQSDTDLSSCETQRNLSDEGREQARTQIAPYYEELDLPVSRLISTEYCRTLETAQLAFGEPEIITRTELTETLDVLFATPPEDGTNVIIVAHIGTLQTVTGLTDAPFAEGDTLIFAPLGDDGYELVGHIALADWEFLAEVHADMMEMETESSE